MVIPPQIVTLIGGLASEATGLTAEKFTEKYGEELLRWVGEIAIDKADVLYDLVGDQAVQFANSALSSAAEKFAEVTGPTAAAILGHVSGEVVGQAVVNALEGLPEVDLAPLGAQVRETAGKGAEQLRHLTDEQLGAFAVFLTGSRDQSSSAVHRLRKKLLRR